MELKIGSKILIVYERNSHTHGRHGWTVHVELPADDTKHRGRYSKKLNYG